MSVKELVLKSTYDHFKFSKLEDGRIKICVNGQSNYLDRNQAHLLMLYLQEHLGYNKIPVTEPKIWLCGCGKYHMKDFVCRRI